MPHVASVAELAHVFPKMLRRHVRVGSSYRAFQQAPVPLDRVGVVNAAHPFFSAVIDGTVLVGAVRQHPVRGRFVGTDCCTVTIR
jgi:hypothetical protein